MANSVNATIWLLYPRASAMAAAMAEEKTIVDSRIKSALLANWGSSIHPLAIISSKIVRPQSTMT